MIANDGTENRRQRIHKITQWIVSALHKNGELKFSEIRAVLEYETGLTKPRLIEYITIGANARRFILDKENDKIKPISDNSSPKEVM